MKYRTLFSERSLRRTPSPIRALFPLSQIPGMLNLAGGLPHPDTFPIKEISIQLQSGTKIDLPSDDVRAALQYGPSYGLPSLLDQLNRFMESRHPRNGNACNSQASRRICVGTGSQDVLGKAFDMLLDPEDMVIVEEACYPGVLCALQVYNPNYLTIKSDEEGMIPSNLDLVVGEACLRAAKTGSKPPRVVYVCPTGQNPTGTTMSTQRKRDIYAVCQAHNLILLEDDPYYHLYFEHDKTSSQRPSFLSLDTDGRVLRFDSLSKVLSAGMRIGWVTGPDELVEHIQLDMQTQALNVSGVSQVFAANILKTLGTQGFDEHVREVCTLYQKRRDQLVAAVRKYLSDEQVTFVVPQAGMFLWMNLNQIKDTEKLVMVRAQDEKVLFVPGCAFQSKKGLTSSFVRASYSTLPEQSMDEAMKRFRLLLDSECSVKS